MSFQLLYFTLCCALSFSSFLSFSLSLSLSLSLSAVLVNLQPAVVLVELLLHQSLPDTIASDGIGNDPELAPHPAHGLV